MTEQTDIYSDFIEAELKVERDRKGVIDTRAAALVTTSGSLITVLTALSAFVGKGSPDSFPRQVAPLLVLALFAFAFAAAAGLWSGWNRPYGTPDTIAMRKMLSDRWQDDEVLARKEVADAYIRMIDNLRATTARKELFLRIGWGCQFLALAVLTVVVLIVLSTR